MEYTSKYLARRPRSWPRSTRRRSNKWCHAGRAAPTAAAGLFSSASAAAPPTTRTRSNDTSARSRHTSRPYSPTTTVSSELTARTNDEAGKRRRPMAKGQPAQRADDMILFSPSAAALEPNISEPGERPGPTGSRRIGSPSGHCRPYRRATRAKAADAMRDRAEVNADTVNAARRGLSRACLHCGCRPPAQEIQTKWERWPLHAVHGGEGGALERGGEADHAASSPSTFPPPSTRTGVGAGFRTARR